MLFHLKTHRDSIWNEIWYRINCHVNIIFAILLTMVTSTFYLCICGILTISEPKIPKLLLSPPPITAPHHYVLLPKQKGSAHFENESNSQLFMIAPSNLHLTFVSDYFIFAVPHFESNTWLVGRKNIVAMRVCWIDQLWEWKMVICKNEKIEHFVMLTCLMHGLRVPHADW
jgi:hypothetical protein